MDRQNTSEVTWKFAYDGSIYGPASTDKVLELCRAGVIQSQTSISSSLCPDWVDASTVAGLRQAMTETNASLSPATVLEGVPSNPGTAVRPPTRRQLLADYGVMVLMLVFASSGVGVLAWSVIGGPDDIFAELAEVRLPLAIGTAASAFIPGFVIGTLLSPIALVFAASRQRAAFRTFFVCAAGFFILLKTVQLSHTQHIKAQVRESALFKEDPAPTTQAHAD